ncbi:MAG: 5'/3'-nucleotidase SurE [Acidimicrobiales bacterium]
MRILVTNDDGIDAVGLHVLARRLGPLGDVVVAAPDREYSGASAAVGTLHLIHPEVRQVALDGIKEAWSVTGPPALCVMFARLGVFGGPFDLVVSGINPGANTGRAIYHSGTVGAALTARNGGVSGLAVSQAVAGFGVEGQGWDEMLADQQWDTAAEVGARAAGALLADLPADPVVINLNVPNLPLEDVKGWRRTEVALLPPRTLASAELTPMAGHEGAFEVQMHWGDPLELPDDTDSGAVEAGYIAVTALSRLLDDPAVDLSTMGEALDSGGG